MKNYTAFLQRATRAIELNVNTILRVPVLQNVCKLLHEHFEQYLQITTIDKWADQFKLSKRMLTAYVTGSDDVELSAGERLREYLLTYEIRQNEITKEIFINRNDTSFTTEELQYNADSEKYNLSHFQKFMNFQNKNITVVKAFNPLQDLFQKLAEDYTGEKLIHQLSDCIPAYDFGDRESGFYQKRLEYYLRKWLYKAVGQALHIGKNDAMLLWIEPLGGSGKSYINKWLFSLPEFENYYVRIGENSSFIDMSGISSSKFVIDWDELPLSQKRYLMFKSYTAAEGGQAYNKKAKQYLTYERQVNFIGSTNKANRERQPGFLLDDDDAMKRRLLSVELGGRINYAKYTKDIDLRQLWGEATHGIFKAQRENDKTLLTYECDYADLRTQNARYVNENHNSQNIILSRFKPADKDTGVLMSASDMLKSLKQEGINANMSPESLGLFLIKHKFQTGRKINYKGYYIQK